MGRRWREGVDKGEVMVHDSDEAYRSRFRGESSHSAGIQLIDLLVQLLGDPDILNSHILPILRRIRFQLGFIPSSQLLARLSPSASVINARATIDPQTMVQAWLTRRLCAGARPQVIVNELLSTIVGRVRQGVDHEHPSRLWAAAKPSHRCGALTNCRFRCDSAGLAQPFSVDIPPKLPPASFSLHSRSIPKKAPNRHFAKPSRFQSIGGRIDATRARSASSIFPHSTPPDAHHCRLQVPARLP